MLSHAQDAMDRLPGAHRPRLWLTLICLLLWLPGFFTLPPGDRDESRFAQATRQMVESGDYVRIRFGEVERNKKPAGIHWAQAASVHALEAVGLGDRADIWAYRIPGLLGAWIAVLATFGFGRHLVGRRAAFLGAAMLAASTVLVVETHIAKTDAALLATITVAMGLFAHAYLSPQAFTARHAAAFWIVLGIGILLKGPVAPMVPLFAGITLAVADRALFARRGTAAATAGGDGAPAAAGGAGASAPGQEAGRAPWLRALRPAWGVPLMLAAALPWFVAITLATEGRFLEEAIGGDMLSKVGSGEESHWGPPGYYLLAFGLSAFPGAWIALRALPGAWRDRMRPATRVLLAWAVPVWLLFEAVATKLPHYVLPAYPPLMLLAAAWALDPLRREPPRWLAGLSWAAVLVVPVGLGLAATVLPVLADHQVDPVALAAPVFGLAFAWAMWRLGRAAAWGRAAMAGVLLAVPLYAVVLEGVLARIEAPWLAPRVAAAVAHAAPGLPPERFGATGYHEPSLVFAMGSAMRLLRDGSEAARFLAGEPGRVVAVSHREEARFRQEVSALGLSVRELGAIAGFNYSRGQRLVLVLYRADAPH